MARAPVSKTGGWGFESLHSCQSQGAENQVSSIDQFLIPDPRYLIPDTWTPDPRSLDGLAARQ